MTDEELEERVREAYADVRMSPEAEDRILANLLAAEADSVKGTGCLTGLSDVDGDGKKHAGNPVKQPVPLTGRRWRWVAPASIAAVLLVGVIVGTQIIPADRSPKDSGTDGGIVLITSGEPEGAAEENDEKPRPHRIQGAAVTDLHKIELALYRLYDRRERDARRLVDEEKPVEFLEHPELCQVSHFRACPGSPAPRRPFQANGRAGREGAA